MTSIIISILIIGVICFIAGFKLGYSKNKKDISSAIDSWKANYYYSNKDMPGSFTYQSDNSIAWETNSTFKDDNYQYDCCENPKESIERKMKKALELEDYEKAAKYRDLLKSLNKSNSDID